jgi:L-asparagine oxygenase
MSTLDASEIVLRVSDADAGRLRAAAEDCVAVNVVEDPDGFVARAQRHAGALPADLIEALRMFRRHGSPTGGFLVRECPVFDVPATPADPGASIGTTLPAAGILGMVSSLLGDQYGFEPELGGRIIQDIVPVSGFEHTQQSISSEQHLFSHVESAFTDDRPDYVALLCLRTDHEQVAATTLCSIERVLPELSAETAAILRQPRFRTAVDASFLHGMDSPGPICVGPIAVLSGRPERPRVRADFAETTANDDEAQRALDELERSVDRISLHIRLEPGDMLFVDNNRAFHGRTTYRARLDGADRWLLRTSITRDLGRSEEHRPGDGRIVHLDFVT